MSDLVSKFRKIFPDASTHQETSLWDKYKFTMHPSPTPIIRPRNPRQLEDAKRKRDALKARFDGSTGPPKKTYDPKKLDELLSKPTAEKMAPTKN